jgi:hypothetical protein
MAKCGECKEDFPEEILSKMFIASEHSFGASGYTDSLCGVCALALTNKAHGTKRTHFQGDIAQYFLEEAKKIKKRRKAKHGQEKT